jgi:hypothetical protein
MKMRLWKPVPSVMLAGLLLSTPAWADAVWTGPGWYVEATQTGLDTELVSGPYADKATCESHQPPDDAEHAYACFYEASGG